VTLGAMFASREPVLKKEKVPWSPAEMVLLAAFLVVMACFIMNSSYYPVVAMDAHSYDGRAQYLLHDGTLDLDMYHWPGSNWNGNSNITYPPLHSLGLALFYALGGVQSKMLSGFFLVAFSISLYGVFREGLPRVFAFLLCIFFSLTPEMMSHASFVLLNVPAAALLTASAICLSRMLNTGYRGWLILAGVFAMGASGVRTDAIPIHLSLGVAFTLAYLIDTRSMKAFLRVLPTFALAWALPLLTWGTWLLYLRFIIGVEALSPFTTVNNIGAGMMWFVVKQVPFHTGTFAYVFMAYLVAFALFLIWGRGDARGRFFHLATLLCFGVIVVMYGFISRDFGGGPKDVLNSSFKRALFNVVPLTVMAIGFSPPWRWLTRVTKHILHRSDPLQDS
ncbi:MAG: hypothetical protein HKN21_17700, partial [Candidatus Eisenbacteria bacterium]|nr:hypothetical protein [Candidatus Eisenbacteria bacterium]